MNNKKTILIVSRSLIIGGLERALLSCINVIPKDKYTITLLIIRVKGFFVKYIPDDVKVITPPFKNNRNASLGLRYLIKNFLKQKNFFVLLKLLFGLLLYELFGWTFILKKILFENQNIKYDYIFNWSGFEKLGDIICNGLYHCNKKYIWIHDEHCLINKNYDKYNKIFNNYDYIFCVSKELTNKVKNKYGNITDKIVTLYNPIDTDSILKLSSCSGDIFEDNYNGCRILSVGRLDYLKGFDIIIKACKILVDKIYDIKWYIVGDGPEKENLISLIKKNNLEDRFVLLGERVNPYPFFKDCDIYVQSSRSEGYCLTLAEAKIFNKPMVTTVFPGTYEQIKDNETGIIVETTPESIAAGVQKLLDNKELREKLSNNLKEENKKPRPDYFDELKKYL